MWRSRLADKRALLILDNAASYRQRVCGYCLAALAVVNRYIVRSGAVAPPVPDDVLQVESPPMESRTAALGWLENERPNVLTCIRRANSLVLYDVVIRLAAAMAPFLRQAWPWDQALGLHRTAVEAARHTGDGRALAGAGDHELAQRGEVLGPWTPSSSTPSHTDAPAISP